MTLTYLNYDDRCWAQSLINEFRCDDLGRRVSNDLLERGYTARDARDWIAGRNYEQQIVNRHALLPGIATPRISSHTASQMLANLLLAESGKSGPYSGVPHAKPPTP